MDHPCTRLVSRYGPERGLYLYGEWCMLVMLGPEAFSARHTPDQLMALGSLLAPLALWPTDGFGDVPVVQDEPDFDPILSIAVDLGSAPLRLACGIDLHAAIGAWAAAGEVAPNAWFEASRAALTEALGLVPPPLLVTLDPDVPTHGYRLAIWGETVLEGVAYPGLDLIVGPADGEPPALPYPWTPDPAGRGWVTWMPIGPASEPPADLARIHWLVAVDRHITAALPTYADRLVSTTVVRYLLAEAERVDYDHELERYVSLPELRLVFRAMLRQGLPLRPMAPMLESMLAAILGELASRPLTPPEVEKLQRQLPVFPTTKLVGIVRRGLGLPTEPASGRADGGRGLRALNVPLAPSYPSPEPAFADALAWQALRSRVAATRRETARLAVALRLADPPGTDSPSLRREAVAPTLDTERPADDIRVVTMAGRLRVDEVLAARARQAVAGWAAAAESVARASRALADAGDWPAAGPAPTHPDWQWVLSQPGRLLTTTLDASDG